MELTDNQRAELGRITLRLYERDTPDLSERGRAAIDARKHKRERLRQLREAWAALDAETQQDVIGHVLREWDEYAHDRPLSDVGRIAGLLEKAMTRPENRAEEHPGLIEATKFLWRAWATDRPGRVPIDRAAVTAIAAELATLFRVARGESERRVTTILREWDKRPDSDMPGRASGNRYADGVRVS